jgi:non-homologous end joining protein Ku
MSEDWKAKVTHLAIRIIDTFKYYTDFINIDDEFKKYLLEEVERKIGIKKVLTLSYVELYKEVKEILDNYAKRIAKLIRKGW